MASSSVPQCTTYVYKRVGDLDLKADVYQPDSRTQGTGHAPVVVWIHGGALVLGTRRDLAATRLHELDLYLGEGWTVVSVDYRLSPESVVPQIWSDIQDAFAWVRGSGSSLFAVDPDRVAAVGPSSGGYLSLLAGARLTPKPKAIVSWFGYGDMTADWYTKPDAFSLESPPVSAEDAWATVGKSPVAELPGAHERRRFYDYARQNGLRRDLIAGDGDIRQYCPAFLVEGDYPPTLLIHGDADTAVPVGQSLQMAEALASADVEHDLVVVPGAAHSFDRKADQRDAQDAIARSLRFLRRHLDSPLT